MAKNVQEQATREKQEKQEQEEVLFAFVLNDALLFKRILDAVSQVMKEAKFGVTEKGIDLVAKDPYHSCQVELFLPQEFFDMFHFPEKEFFVGLNVEDMTGLFKGISGDTSVEFRVIGNGWVLLELKSESSTRQFKLRAVDIGGQKERRLDIPFQFKAELSTGLYQDIVSFLKLGSEQAVFLASEEELAVESATYSRINKMLIFKDSPYVIQYSLKAPKDGAEENTTNEEPCIRALYSTKFLKKFLAGTKLSDSFMLEFSKNKPMKLTFPIPGGGTLAYAVAPRLEY